MFERVKMKQINDHIWLMNDHDEATGYIVLGTKKALIIDTMNGYENVKKIAESITKLPIMVVNTHGHPDHIYGNIYFEEAYLHPRDMKLAQLFYDNPEFQKEAKKRGLKPAAFKPILGGEKIDLGGIELEVYEIPGHSAGGICLLDRADRILFSGDSINKHTWMQSEDNLPMTEFLKSLERLQSIRSAYDFILTGHSSELEDGSNYEALKKAVKEVCEGKNENDIPYKWFGGICKAHPYGKETRLIVYK